MSNLSRRQALALIGAGATVPAWGQQADLVIGTGDVYDGDTDYGPTVLRSVRCRGSGWQLRNCVVNGPVTIEGPVDPAYNWRISHVRAQTFRIPETSYAFFGTFEHCIATGAGWGFDLWTAGSTLLTLRHCWTVQTAGQAAATSAGFRIRACEGLQIESAACDHLRSSPLFLESCSGQIGSFRMESCDLSGPAVTFSNCRLRVDEFRAVLNRAADQTILLRNIVGSRTEIAHLIDSETRAAGAYYTAQNDGRLTVKHYERVGSTPSPLLTDWAKPATWRDGGFEWQA